MHSADGRNFRIYVRPLISMITFSAAVAMSSCSQNRITVHPASRSTRFVSRSRSLLRRIFSDQNSLFVFGVVPCIGQPCQKQPSTKIAICFRVKTMSARLLSVFRGAWSTRNRSPARWRIDRRASSLGVSRCRTDCILRRTFSEEALGGCSR